MVDMRGVLACVQMQDHVARLVDGHEAELRALGAAPTHVTLDAHALAVLGAAELDAAIAALAAQVRALRSIVRAA
jgi:uncharacterized small protein (DUF1192 family)